MTRSHNSRRGKGSSSCSRWYRTHGVCWRNAVIDVDEAIAALTDLGVSINVQDTEEQDLEVEWMPLGSTSLEIDGSTDGDAWIEVDGAASEWSVVSSAETAWSCIADEQSEASGTPWEDDAALARRLQEEEWEAAGALGSLRKGGGAIATAQRRWRRRGTPLPVVPEETRASLVDHYGMCVVCSDSVATVAWEPCGHLCMCAGCLMRLEDTNRALSFACVVCRTPGTATNLLAAERGGADPSPRDGATVDAKSGRVRATATVEELCGYRHGQASLTDSLARLGSGSSKLGHRRAKRMLNRLTVCPRVVRLGRVETWRELYAWRDVSPRTTRPLNTYVLHSAPQLVDALMGGIAIASPSAHSADRAGVHFSASRDVAVSKAALRRHAEEHRRERRQLEGLFRHEAEQQRQRLAAVAAAAKSLAALGGACSSCGERRASMLALECGHVSLCRECWLASPGHSGPSAGGGADTSKPSGLCCPVCARTSKVAIQLYRP